MHLFNKASLLDDILKHYALFFPEKVSNNSNQLTNELKYSLCIQKKYIPVIQRKIEAALVALSNQGFSLEIVQSLTKDIYQEMLEERRFSLNISDEGLLAFILSKYRDKIE